MVAKQQLLPGLDSPLRGSIKNERSVMAYSFFSLSKEPRTELEPYDDGKVRIEVKGTKAGVATVYDKELLIYAASLIVDKANRGERIGPKITFAANDFFRVVHIQSAGTAYERVTGALERLQGTQIKTTIETGGEGTDSWFSWLKDARANYRKDPRTGERVLQSVTLEICDWLYRAIERDNKMLTYHPEYFELGVLEKRLYELARAHCGHQPGFRIGLEKLRRRVGSEMQLKDFRIRMSRIAEKQKPLPEYGFKLEDRSALRPGADGKPRQRMKLENVLVVFWRLDRWRDYSLERFPDVDEIED